MTKKIIAIALMLTCLFTSCNETTKQDNQPVLSADTTASKMEPVTNLLIGSWVQPIPGIEKDVQGIKINADGSASSINMATLVYKKWWEDKGKLTLVSESIGNGSSSMDTVVFEVVKNTGKELEIKTTDYTEKYTKQ